MDKMAEKIAALGVPALVFIVAMGATGLSGAAAITTALAALGPFGMLGGLVTLGVLGLISESIAKFGAEAIFSGVVIALYKRGETKESILKKINKYPISNELKQKIKKALNKVEDNEK